MDLISTCGLPDGPAAEAMARCGDDESITKRKSDERVNNFYLRFDEFYAKIKTGSAATETT